MRIATFVSIGIASLVVAMTPADAQETTISVDGISLMQLSRKQSTRADSYGIYERSLRLLGPTDGSEELGSSWLYGALYLTGDSHRAALGVGPGLALHSAFPVASDNRAFYIILGDQHNLAAEKGDVVFESWNDSRTTHVLHMIFKPNGDVGIGVVNPGYRLQVNGAAAATSWVNLSSREYKENIEPVGAAEQHDMLKALMKLNVSRYDYRKDVEATGRRRIGFVAEEMPKDVLSADGKGVDVYELLAVTIAAMKAQQQQIIELERKVAGLSAPSPTP
jgi:hypothetical protein